MSNKNISIHKKATTIKIDFKLENKNSIRNFPISGAFNENLRSNYFNGNLDLRAHLLMEKFLCK